MKNCDLCKGLARTYCDSDQASLCWNCDSKVHSANFLVARHSRTILCHDCHSLTPWKASGAELGVTVSVCQKCVFGARNRCSDKDSKRGVNCYEFEEAEDDDNDDYYEDEDEDEDDELSDTDEDGDNQVVPWSSSLMPPPPSSSSSCSEDSTVSLTNGGVEVSREPSEFTSKTMRENNTSGFRPQVFTSFSPFPFVFCLLLIGLLSYCFLICALDINSSVLPVKFLLRFYFVFLLFGLTSVDLLMFLFPSQINIFLVKI